MDNNGFNEFDSFDSSGGFGGDFGGDFGSEFGDSSSSSNFNGSDANNGFDEFNSLGDMDGTSSNSAFDTDSNQFTDATQGGRSLTNQSIIFIIVGIIGIILVIFIATRISNKSNKNEAQMNNIMQQEQTTINENTEVNGNVNVDNIIKDNTTTVNKPSKVIVKDDNFTWTDITNSENVNFNDEYVEMTFTVTSIQHKARTVDNNNNLVVKTKILGSISGLSGTYELDIPYNKGVKLVVGNSFTVHVQLGTFNDKTVVGEIKY